MGGDEGRDGRALESGGEGLASEGQKPALGPTHQPASVSLLLTVIYQRVSSCDVMDLADFD